MRALLAITAASICWTTAALTASDQAQRAAYCMAVVKKEIADHRERTPAMARAVSQFYEGIARQRRLTPDEQRALSSAKKNEGFAEMDRHLVGVFERLRLYAMGNTNLDDTMSILVANRQAEIDFAQCAAERQQTSVSNCSFQCGKSCKSGDVACLQRCDTSCGAPTCSRTLACLNPTWLPY